MRSILAGLVVGLSATAAHADGTLIGRCLSDGPEVTCPVNLVNGQDYELVADYDEYNGTAKLINPAGETTIELQTYGSQEFRAAFSATYNVKVAGSNEFEYFLANLYTDCKAGVKTQCNLSPGQKKQSRNTSNQDRDWYRSNLQNGRVYTFILDGLGTYTDMALLDKNGRTLARAHSNVGAPGTLRYRTRYAGTYYLQTEKGQQYTISLR